MDYPGGDVAKANFVGWCAFRKLEQEYEALCRHPETIKALQALRKAEIREVLVERSSGTEVVKCRQVAEAQAIAKADAEVARLDKLVGQKIGMMKRELKQLGVTVRKDPSFPPATKQT